MFSLLILPLACFAPAPIEYAPEPQEENRVLHAPSPSGPPEDALQDMHRPAPAGGDNESDQQAIGQVVKRSNGLVQACVEAALHKRSDLNGRVGVGWKIDGGRVSDVHTVENTTGDRSLEGCILDVVRRLKFDPAITATVSEFPWVIGP